MNGLKAQHLRALKDVATRLSELEPHNENELGLIGFMLGSAYGLREAFRHDYQDKTVERLPAGYQRELRLVAMSLSADTEVDQERWLAGFYFNTALQRMGALNERIGKHFTGKKSDRVSGIRRDVNILKHGPQSLLLVGRKVSLDEAVAGLKRLADWLEEHMKTTASVHPRNPRPDNAK